MDIGGAVSALREGRPVRRAGWNGRGMALFYAVDGVVSSPIAGEADGRLDIVLQPHVVMRTVDGTFVPWLCSQTDLLADDWEAADR